MADHSIKGKTDLIAGGAKNLGGLIARDPAKQGAGAVAIHTRLPDPAASGYMGRAHSSSPFTSRCSPRPRPSAG